jgi:hypothetical protein
MRFTVPNLAALFLTAILAASAAVAGAQQRGAPPEEVKAFENSVVFSASIEMVRVPVVVTDIEGAFITGLDRRNFLVLDGPAVQPIEHFVSDNEPTSVGILLDASAEMAPFADLVRVAAQKLADELKEADELFLISAGASAQLLSPPSKDRGLLQSAVARFLPGDVSDRAFYDAIALALSELDHSSFDKRALILFTTGDESASRVDATDLMKAAQRLGVAIHLVHLSTTGAPAVEDLVRLSGGLIARRPGIEDRYGGIGVWLDLAIADICRYVNNQYLLHYTPLSPPPPGMWRRIRVKVDVPFEEVRARSGYVRW